MDTINTVNDVQEPVVEAQTEGSSVEADAGAVAHPAQSAEDNSKFAAMRRRMEQAQRDAADKDAELEALKKQVDRTNGLINRQYGYNGSLAEIADQMEAAEKGIDVSEVRNARLAAESRDAEIAGLKAEMEQYKTLAVQKYMADLLSEVKAVYPDVTATSVEDFGEDFARLIGSGVAPAVAYAAVQSTKEAGVKKPPAEIGRVNTSTDPERDFFSREEVKKMSKAEISKHYDTIRKSMIKW